MSEAELISPIDKSMQQAVIKEVDRYLSVASRLYEQSFDAIPVLFDLKGKAAGMYRVRRASPQLFSRKIDRDTQRVIRFNPWLFAKYPDDSWQNTIPHEVAHYLTDCLYGLRNIRPHGAEWKHIMQTLGAEPKVRANYDLSGIPVRQVKRYTYQCQCREVQLSGYRHQRILKGMQRYRCRDCQSELTYISSV